MRQIRMTAALALALAAGGGAGGCGKKKDPGFDWNVKRTAESGKVQATLRRFAILPRAKEFLETEREGISASPIRPGVGYYLVCEVGITVDGKALWELPDGAVTQLGPLDFLQSNRQLTGQIALNPSKVPAAVRNDSRRRDAWTVMMPCPPPKFDDPQPFEIKLALALKGNQKHSFRWENLKVPADAFVEP
jgi:hypothetical protein